MTLDDEGWPIEDLGFADILREWPHWAHIRSETSSGVVEPILETVKAMRESGHDIHMVNLRAFGLKWQSGDQEYFNLYVSIRCSKYNWLVATTSNDSLLIFLLQHKQLVRNSGVGLEQLRGPGSKIYLDLKQLD